MLGCPRKLKPFYLESILVPLLFWKLLVSALIAFPSKELTTQATMKTLAPMAVGAPGVASCYWDERLGTNSRLGKPGYLCDKALAASIL